MTFWDNLVDFKRAFADGPFRPGLYDGAYADKAEAHALNDASRAELDWVAARAPGATRVLDIGCNTGRPLDHLCRAWRATGTGVDVNAPAVERARQDLPHLTFTTYDGATLPLDDASVDHVMIHHVLAHVADPGVTLTEARRVLVPGGTLSIVTPNRAYKIRQFPMNLLRGFRPDVTVLRYYSADRLRDELAAAGFAVTTLETLGALPDLGASESSRLRLMVMAEVHRQ